ncbi:MAG: hypothetical protein VX246_15040 [Myxococcota bacterium]|nr:hypothetical protein [Myxococcota bacterium]
MNLNPLEVLRSASIGMLDGSMLGPREGYEQASSLVFGLALGIVADQLETAAADLVEENDVIRGLFREALAIPDVGSADLRTRWEAPGNGSEDSLLVSVLRETNDVLRDLLSELLVAVEAVESADARRLEEHIWDELNRSTERRAVAIAPF